ncbi:hypothetical protein EHYA_09595 [Embleya hyalina]|uniref:Uncharacterized protein n=1 Tax=Embleya hyalina TaxID=516124 RepID=A0A401Z4P1_9ACTN|nr:hypothetical protein EHYA_09595 [Embleya hyalina]
MAAGLDNNLIPVSDEGPHSGPHSLYGRDDRVIRKLHRYPIDGVHTTRLTHRVFRCAETGCSRRRSRRSIRSPAGAVTGGARPPADPGVPA